jgi:MYXO-CTERM domain-containing protein
MRRLFYCASMSLRRAFLVPIGTAILSALAAAAPSGLLVPSAEAQVTRPRDDEDAPDPLLLAPPARDDSVLLAHRSHSSHSSHRSHSSHSSHYSGQGNRGDGSQSPMPAQPRQPTPAPKPTNTKPPPAPAPTNTAPPPEPDKPEPRSSRCGCSVPGEPVGAPTEALIFAAALVAASSRRRRDE